MILSAQSIRKRYMINPFYERTVFEGMTFGLSAAGYDIRIAQTLVVFPGEFRLASAIEHFRVPNDVLAQVADKSSWARKGIAVQNTIIEPGWTGYLTLEITNHSREIVSIPYGAPIAQIVFMQLDEPTEQPYVGKYQNQPNRPVEAINEPELPL